MASEGCSLLLCRFLCSGFSCCRAQALEHIGFSSCSTWAQQLWHRGLVALRYVGSSPIRDRTALAGRFLFTVPPGDSLKLGFIFVCAQSFLTLCNPMDCSLPGSSVFSSMSISTQASRTLHLLFLAKSLMNFLQHQHQIPSPG